MTAARAAVWSGTGFRVTEVALPALEPDEALVELELATICGSDVHTVAGHRSTPVPTVLGHEGVGRVVATRGATALDGAALAIGDRVVWTIGTSCGHCRRCARGLPQKCTSLRKYGHEAIDDHWRLNGTLASHVHLVPGTGVVRVDDDLPPELAAPAGCATATVAGAVRRTGLGPHDRLVVVGCGMLGLSAVAMARDLGVTSVVACDVDAERRELAAELGASTVCAPGTLADAVAEEGADVVLEMSGHHDAVRAALDLVDLGGRVALVGSVSPGPAVALDPERVVRNLTTVVGSHNYTPLDLLTAVDFLARTGARRRLAALVAPAYSLGEVEAGFAAAKGGVAPRVGVRPG